MFVISKLESNIIIKRNHSKKNFEDKKTREDILRKIIFGGTSLDFYLE